MTTEHKTLTYDRAKFTDYSKQRAELIELGWEVEDENLLKTCLIVDILVTGSVVFKRIKR